MMNGTWRRFGVLGAVLIALLGTMFASIEMVSANASSPTQPSVALSSSAAGASGVTYTVAFSSSSTGAIPAGGSITLVGTPGTVFPSSGRTYAITDSTTPSGSDGCISCSSGSISVVDNGAAVTIRLNNAINAADVLSLSVSQVVNPGAGSYSLALSTSADTTPIDSTSYIVTAAASVTQPSVALSSSAAGASGVTYTLGFSASSTGALPAGDIITLVATPGTVFPSSGRTYAITDSTTASGTDTCISCSSGSLAVTDNGAAVSIRLNNAINAGDALSLSVSQVTNPSVGTYSLALSTSTDALPENSTSYAITAPLSITQPSVALSSSAAGASGVTYTLGFSASGTGALAAGDTITLVGAPGTVFPSSGHTYAITDSTSPSGSDGCISCSSGSLSVADNGAVVAIKLNNAINAGDALSLAVSQVTNPGAGSYSLAVFTSTDATPVQSASYTITGSVASSTAVTSPSLTVSTTAAGASGVTYSTNFTTSASGQLVGGSSSVTLVAPGGTVLGTCSSNCISYTFVDHTNSSGSGGGNNGDSAAIAGSGSIISIAVPNTIHAGDSVTLTITGVTNPPVGSGTIELSTSSDASGVSLNDPMSSPNSVLSATVVPTSTAAGASGVTYSANFTTSATGELVGGSSSVTLVAPVGTVLGTCGQNCINYTFVDHTNPSGSGGGNSGDSASIARGGSIISVTVPNTIHAGDSVTLSITGVTNPSAGDGAVILSTNSDTAPVDVAAPTTAASQVSNVSVNLSNSAVGASGTIYEANFTTSSTGALQGGLSAITLRAAPGTVFTASGTATITDNTHKSGSGSVGPIGLAQGGAIALFVVPNAISAGDSIALVVQGVTNASSVGANSLAVTTSSDTVPSAGGYTLGQATSISGTVEGPGASGGVQGSEVEACANTVLCATTTTDVSGHFQLTVIEGAYALTALPPSGSGDTPSTPATFTVGGTPLTGVTIALTGAATLGGGVSLVTAAGQVLNSSTAAPRSYWMDPYQLQLSPSLFPTGKTVVVTQVVVHGTNVETGQSAEQVVNVGGSVGGLPTGVVLGSQPIDVEMPAPYPIHGPVSYTFNYQTYSAVAVPPGLAATQILDLVYPNQAPSEPQTEPLAAYLTNYGDPPGIGVGGGSIAGVDASTFSIVPLSDVGVPAGTNDCGGSSITLTQYDGSVSGPAQANQCGVGIQFTPPSGTDQLFFNATLQVETSTGATVPIRLVGCDENVAQAAAAVTGYDPCNPGGPDPDDGPEGDSDVNGGGGGGGDGGDGGGQGDGGGLYIDPSGTVLATTGSGPAQPLSGAA